MSAWESLPWSKQVEALFRQHAEKVYRCAVRGLDGDIDQAKDVVQQVFLAVCKKYIADFQDKTDDHQEAMIMTITHRRVIDYWRDVSRTRETLCGELEGFDQPREELAAVPTSGTTRSDRIAEDGQLKRFWESLTRDLTRMEYRVALMSWEMGLSAEAIANALNTSVPAVTTHRSRARRKIQAALTQQRAWERGGDI
ncbi:sigma-70 family RNA polymerase sigma factor [Nocardia sp. CA2R105]|uniref:RNA polymerase sigma factor n=1 Tax=Nocardia coffeae TaxID=2873381 RepID=UPI001CA62C8B|nr:sigma-70 family RNA polymerase sigma factor [Nocardia coffeae]MBY8863887.1 sigma-70 family RNA polymerase sigma factor [Nocardia coffeae]